MAQAKTGPADFKKHEKKKPNLEYDIAFKTKLDSNVMWSLLRYTKELEQDMKQPADWQLH